MKDNIFLIFLNNSQDVLSLVKLLAPNDFRFFEIRKMNDFYIAKTKRVTRSNSCFYLFTSTDKLVISEIRKNVKRSLKQEFDMELGKMDFSFGEENSNGVSKVKHFNNNFLMLINIKTNRKIAIEIERLIYKLNVDLVLS